MKESNSDDLMNNTNNNENQNSQHNIKDSTVVPLEADIKQSEIQEEKENGTIATTMEFLKPNNEENNSPLYNLNKSLQKTEDSSTINIPNNIPNDQSGTNESFYQKTKRWAGTVWGYVNIANYFPKTEYLEYRNANGDMVKVPKKKLPLKKKALKETQEEHIINRTVETNSDKVNTFAADNVPLASHFI